MDPYFSVRDVDGADGPVLPQTYPRGKCSEFLTYCFII
jgi:hypothetical protein